MTISKKKREKVLKLIRDFEEKREKNTYITEEYLFNKGVSKDEILQILRVLEGMEYIEYKNVFATSQKYIFLTDKGKCYFETKKDDRIDFIKKNIFVPIIVSVITTLTTLVITNYINIKYTNNNVNKIEVEK